MIFQFGKGPVMVLVNGFMCDRTTLNAQIEEFSKDHTVLLVNLTGRKVDVESLIQDINTKLDELKAKKIIIGGYSLGSAVAMAYASLYPKRVKKLMLISGAASFKFDPITLFGFWVTTWFPLSKLPNSLILLTIKVKGIANKHDRKIIPDLIKISNDSKVSDLRQQFKMIRGLMIANKKLNLTKLMLKNINMPTMILSGTADKLISPSHARKLHSIIKNSQLIMIKDSSHYYIMSKPELSNDLIRAFIAEK